LLHETFTEENLPGLVAVRVLILSLIINFFFFLENAATEGKIIIIIIIV